MNPFSQANLAVASRRIEIAIARFEEYATAGGASTFGDAFRELLHARHALDDIMRLEAMQEEATLIEAARTKADGS